MGQESFFIRAIRFTSMGSPLSYPSLTILVATENAADFKRARSVERCEL